MRSVVITGASTGIGYASAKLLVAAGFRVFGSVRNKQDAARVAKELGTNFTPLVFDITDEQAVKNAAAKVREALAGETLAGLVNNAGVSVPGPVLEIPIDDFRRQIEINVVGQVIVLQAFAPMLGADPSFKGPPGRIVMISSVAGKRALPFAGPYSASKHAIEGLSESLRREMMLFGIDVVVIGPGPIKTAIWAKGEKVDLSRWSNTPYFEPIKKMRGGMQAMGASGLPAEDVAQLVLHALTGRKPWVRYTITPGQGSRWLMSLLPRRVQDRLIAKRLGLMPKAN
ncbi:MAG TPA: SDR family oxidoreductase [Xanthobacteraceae bacterium]|nr:SDR family oxidoreductase [Xanthobacteraceae bacterium]